MSELNLRVVRHVDGLSEAVAEYLTLKEGSAEWVDGDLARDFGVTQEIMENTIEYGVADDEGEILATFATLEEAENARKRAKVQVNLVVDFDEDEEEAPKVRAGKPAPKDAPVTSILSDIRTPAEV